MIHILMFSSNQLYLNAIVTALLESIDNADEALARVVYSRAR